MGHRLDEGKWWLSLSTKNANWRVFKLKLSMGNKETKSLFEKTNNYIINCENNMSIYQRVNSYIYPAIFGAFNGKGCYWLRIVMIPWLISPILSFVMFCDATISLSPTTCMSLSHFWTWRENGVMWWYPTVGLLLFSCSNSPQWFADNYFSAI